MFEPFTTLTHGQAGTLWFATAFWMVWALVMTYRAGWWRLRALWAAQDKEWIRDTWAHVIIRHVDQGIDGRTCVKETVLYSCQLGDIVRSAAAHGRISIMRMMSDAIGATGPDREPGDVYLLISHPERNDVKK